jgi:uncharacterized protein YcnI/copper(I)-binding protein
MTKAVAQQRCHRMGMRMKTRMMMALTGLCASVGWQQAQAHVSFANPTVAREKTAVISLQIPHGCEGMPTNEVRISLPEGFVFAKPQPKPGWELEIITGKYARAYDNHGDKVTSGPVEIRWKGGELADAFYDTFNIQGKVSGIEAGERLAFPTVQICGDKQESWIDIVKDGADPHSLKSPAPTLLVAAGDAAGQGGHDHSGMHMDAGMAMATESSAIKVEDSEIFTAGDITVTGAYARAMLPGQPVGGGYLTVKNMGTDNDRLVSAASPSAGVVELHEMAIQSETMRMRKVNNGIAIPAGGTVELKPGGFHFMFMKVKEPFKAGGTVPLTLTFEKAGPVDVLLPIKPAGPPGMQHD